MQWPKNIRLKRGHSIYKPRCGSFKKIDMKLNFAKSFVFFIVIVGCQTQEKQIKDYGFPTKDNNSLEVSLKISDFENYGVFIDRISEITCNDSIPKIVIEENTILRNIYPLEHCEPAAFDPDEKHYVFFERGKPYKDSFSKEIKSDSLNYIIKNDYPYFKSINDSTDIEGYLVIIQTKRNEKVDGIEQFLTDLTQEFDKLNTEMELKISFWELGFYSPPE